MMKLRDTLMVKKGFNDEGRSVEIRTVIGDENNINCVYVDEQGRGCFSDYQTAWRVANMAEEDFHSND